MYKKLMTALRNHYTFESTRGPLTFEQVCDLPLTTKNGAPSLDQIAIGLNKQIKEAGESESFVLKTTTKATDVLQIKFDLVKDLIDTKLAEQDAARKAAATKAEIATIQGLLAEKKNAALAGSSVEDLEKKLADLAANLADATE